MRQDRRQKLTILAFALILIALFAEAIIIARWQIPEQGINGNEVVPEIGQVGKVYSTG